MPKLFYKVKHVLLFAVLSIVINQLSAQIRINGPRCIIPGITYQYDIKNSREDSTDISITIKGGTITSGIRASTDRVKVSSVFVVWKDTAYHQVDIQSKKGKASLLVNQTAVLTGGKLQEGDNVQQYDARITRYTFHCSLPTGGSCTPNYVYQWQQSADGLKWADIANAKEKDFVFSGKPESGMYFRRIASETQSNNISYSDVASLIVLWHK